jgi:hypothetical protein
MAPRDPKVTRQGEYDAHGRTKWLIEWTDQGTPHAQLWFGSAADLTLLLARNGFAASAPRSTIRCPKCGGLTRFADGPCDRCMETGTVPACAACWVEPVDPLFAPACSGHCRETWETQQKLQQLREARAP